MLLKSIKLENFRQFRNESIDFAQGEGGKNVTIIIGENGTGKTTFAQAFFWCLYGETEFSDKIILNKMVATEMTPGSEEKVRVTLALRHGEVDYVLYEKLVEGDSTPEAFANRLYEFIDEFNDRFNSEISSNDILQLCVNKS